MARWAFQFWLSLPHWLYDLCTTYKGVCGIISFPLTADNVKSEIITHFLSLTPACHHKCDARVTVVNLDELSNVYFQMI